MYCLVGVGWVDSFYTFSVAARNAAGKCRNCRLVLLNKTDVSEILGTLRCCPFLNCQGMVTLFDGQYSFRQNELATKGIQHGGHKMSAEQAKTFEASPFMVKVQAATRSRLTSERDKLRKQTDKDTLPQVAFDYDKGINYYTVLGVDEYAPLEEIKKAKFAYKKLSLLYHPDKTSGLTKEETAESDPS
eukprot:Skav229054  [mRNA]  locus=scaffold2828:165111:169075:+ [translate_table: standard]